MCGLDGPKSEDLKKVLVFKAFLKGSREPGASQECKEVSEPEHFLVTLRSLFVYDGDFGRLWAHFGAIVR